MLRPALVGNNSFLQQLVVLVGSDRQPVAQLAVVERVGDFKNLPSGERKALRRLLLVLKVGSDEERVASARSQNIFIH